VNYLLPERHAHSECPASRKENLYVSNLALLEDGIAGRGSVQFRHRSNLGIASCNKASTSGVRYSVIERVRVDASRKLDRGSVGGREERMGQGRHQMGRLPEAMEQTKGRRSEELAIPLQVHDQLRVEGSEKAR